MTKKGEEKYKEPEDRGVCFVFSHTWNLEKRGKNKTNTFFVEAGQLEKIRGNERICKGPLDAGSDNQHVNMIKMLYAHIKCHDETHCSVQYVLT